MAKLSLEKKTELVAHCMGTTDGYVKTARVFGVSKAAQVKGTGISVVSIPSWWPSTRISPVPRVEFSSKQQQLQ